MQQEKLGNASSARDAAHLRCFSETMATYNMSIESIKENLAWVKVESDDVFAFFQHQGTFFGDCHSEINAMDSQTSLMIGKREKLGDMLRNMNEHRTNATLYVLTIVTTLVRIQVTISSCICICAANPS